jgi:hypothetical protein
MERNARGRGGVWYCRAFWGPLNEEWRVVIWCMWRITFDLICFEAEAGANDILIWHSLGSHNSDCGTGWERERQMFIFPFVLFAHNGHLKCV